MVVASRSYLVLRQRRAEHRLDWEREQLQRDLRLLGGSRLRNRIIV